MAKAREIEGLAGAESFGSAAAAAVEVRASEVFEHLHRALDIGDIEGVHDMRVATRRLRAVMEIFAPCFPKDAHRSGVVLLLPCEWSGSDAATRRRMPAIARSSGRVVR